MDQTITKAVSFEEQTADEYRYWQSVPPTERIGCGPDLSKEAYRRKGLYSDGQGLDRTLVFLQPLRTTSNNLGTQTR